MDRELTLVEHLNELRARLIKSLIALMIAGMASFPMASGVLKVLKLPAEGLIERLVFFSPQEAFTINLRIAFLVGLVIAMPVILYQLWAFISPAIEARFKKYAGPFIIWCFIAFASGALFSYFMLLPPALRFLLSFASDELEPVISATKYISFVTGLILGCGIVFQMPVFSLILTKIGIINPKMLRKRYKYAIVIVFIAAAVITPTTDVFNMLLLAAPMMLLYEVSIWVSFFAKSRVRGV